MSAVAQVKETHNVGRMGSILFSLAAKSPAILLYLHFFSFYISNYLAMRFNGYHRFFTSCVSHKKKARLLLSSKITSQAWPAALWRELDSESMESFQQDALRFGCLRGFKHMSLRPRGKEELLVTVHHRDDALGLSPGPWMTAPRPRQRDFSVDDDEPESPRAKSKRRVDSTAP